MTQHKAIVVDSCLGIDPAEDARIQADADEQVEAAFAEEVEAEVVPDEEPAPPAGGPEMCKTCDRRHCKHCKRGSKYFEHPDITAERDRWWEERRRRRSRPDPEASFPGILSLLSPWMITPHRRRK